MSANTGDDEIPDNLICPVCFNLPEKEVYQCRDGHILCKTCYFKLEECPQCRDPLEKRKPIRCRVMEGLLESLIVDCAFKSNGCDKKFPKNLISNHQVECFHDFKKFGKPVFLCKLLGYINCKFQVNNGNTEQAVKHFISSHGFHFTKEEEFQLKLCGFPADTSKSDNIQVIWAPIILHLKDKQCYVLVLAFIKDKSFCYCSLLLPYASNKNHTDASVEFKLHRNENDSALNMSFSHKARPILGIETLPQEHKLPISFVGHFSKNSFVLIDCRVLSDKNKNKDEKQLFTCTKLVVTHATTVKKLTPSWDIDDGTPEAKGLIAIFLEECRHTRYKLLAMLDDAMTVNPRNIHLFIDYSWDDMEWLKKGLTFLIARHGTLEAMEFLVKKGVEIDFISTKWESPLQHCLVYDDDPRIGLQKAKFLVENGANVFEVCNNKRNLLHYTATVSTVEAVEYLLEKGLDVNAVDSNGLTPLHLAMFNGKEKSGLKIAKVLLEHGADPNAKNDEGLTPLQCGLKVISSKHRDYLMKLFQLYEKKTT